ncbi:rhodanese-like domain-containing protein [Ectothiorhodospiraceae bacterium BW-2]|nr:rhodanese-like domain-containing protein [Ectothiorhodospiraceae bacterium BW-2]
MNRQTNPSGVSPEVCWQALQSNRYALLIDVRSSMEYLFVGHPRGAIHLPWIDEPDWDVNPDFVKQVRQLLLERVAQGGENRTEIYLICRSGNRSHEAGKQLLEAGLERVFNVLEGFEGELDEQHHRSTLGGWRFAGLPWEQC